MLRTIVLLVFLISFRLTAFDRCNELINHLAGHTTDQHTLRSIGEAHPNRAKLFQSLVRKLSRLSGLASNDPIVTYERILILAKRIDSVVKVRQAAPIVITEEQLEDLKRNESSVDSRLHNAALRLIGRGGEYYSYDYKARTLVLPGPIQVRGNKGSLRTLNLDDLHENALATRHARITLEEVLHTTQSFPFNRSRKMDNRAKWVALRPREVRQFRNWVQGNLDVARTELIRQISQGMIELRGLTHQRASSYATSWRAGDDWDPDDEGTKRRRYAEFAANKIIEEAIEKLVEVDVAAWYANQGVPFDRREESLQPGRILYRLWRENSFPN